MIQLLFLFISLGCEDAGELLKTWWISQQVPSFSYTYEARYGGFSHCSVHESTARNVNYTRQQQKSRVATDRHGLPHLAHVLTLVAEHPSRAMNMSQANILVFAQAHESIKSKNDRR